MNVWERGGVALQMCGEVAEIKFPPGLLTPLSMCEAESKFAVHLSPAAGHLLYCFAFMVPCAKIIII